MHLGGRGGGGSNYVDTPRCTSNKSHKCQAWNLEPLSRAQVAQELFEVVQPKRKKEVDGVRYLIKKLNEKARWNKRIEKTQGAPKFGYDMVAIWASL